MKSTLFLFAVLVCVLGGSTPTFTQSGLATKRAVCGDPKQTCKSRAKFSPDELPWDMREKDVIAETVPFYAVVLESMIDKGDDSCAKKFPPDVWKAAQNLFPRNKVFVNRCELEGINFYENLSYSQHADGYHSNSFMAVFAGTTRQQANAFLKKVKASGKYKDAYLRKTKIHINGT